MVLSSLLAMHLMFDELCRHAPDIILTLCTDSESETKHKILFYYDGKAQLCPLKLVYEVCYVVLLSLHCHNRAMTISEK